MKIQWVMSLMAAAALAAPAAGQNAVARAAAPASFGATAESYSLAPSSTLWLEGDSNVRSFRCEAGNLSARVQATGAAGATPAGLAKSVQSVQLTVGVGKLDCGNGTMNEHMWKALDAWDNPAIRFQLQSHQVVREGSATVTKMKGQLTIAGRTQPVTLEGAVTQKGTGLRVVGSKEIKMTEFGVKPPSLMLGTMKVADMVTIHFDLVLTQ